MAIPPDFKGAALKRSPTIYNDIATWLNLPIDVLRAYLMTEVTSETGFRDNGLPQELLERHWFHKLTGGKFDAVAPEVSDAKAGGYLTQPAEWDRFLTAYELAPHEALMSTSWCIAQIMGFNYKVCGFDSVEAMVEAFLQSEDNQLWAFAKFLVSCGIDKDLREGRYRDAIGKYNGYGNVDAYLRRWTANLARVRNANNYGDATRDDGVARHNLAGIQAVLNLLGYGPLSVDGISGDKTKAAVMRFQSDQGDLAIDGIAGPATSDALFSELPIPMARKD